MPKRFRKKKDITGQIVLITGAGGGLGRALAKEFSRHSTCLVLLDINEKSLLETEKLIGLETRVFTYECDVTNRKMVYEVASKIKAEVGDVDILVNNAGVVNGKYLLDLPDERIIKTIEVNALSHFWVCKAFLPAMMTMNRGHIVSIASIMGQFAIPQLTDYCASKYAVVGFTEALAMELREKKLDGIKVTTVCPSHIDTGLFDGTVSTIGSMLTPEYTAEEIVEAVREGTEHLFIPYIFTFLYHIKSTFPPWVTVRFFELTGNINAMQNFKGRSNTDNSHETSNGRSKME